jgi:tetratricopeptide (TPR) repeat protein
MRLARFAGLFVFILAIWYLRLRGQDYSLRVDVTAALAKAPWFEVQSRHFHVTGDADTKQLRRIAVDLEEIRRQFLTVFPKKAASSVPTTVIVFRNAKSLRLFFEPRSEAGGFYADFDRNYIVLNAGEKQRRSVYHDYINALIGNHPLPLWLREGLAEYYGSIENDRFAFGEDRTLEIGKPIGAHEKMLGKRSFMPLNELFAMTDQSPAYAENNQKSVFLAESWALVHMMHSPGFVDLLKRLLELLVDKNPARESFNAVYHEEPSRFEEPLKDYVKTAAWPYTRIPYCMCESKPLDWLQFNFDSTQSYVKEQGETKLTDARVRFYLGDLLLHSGSLDVAETYLQAALQLDPKLAAAHASLAVLRVRQGHYDEAKEHIERALALGSDNPLPYLFYARLIRQQVPASTDLTEEQLQNMQTSLLNAVRFGPNLSEAADLLSEVDALLGQDSAKR